ncbi:MAG: hypothetical protein WCI71_07845 [Bacteroidota bacterium]
MNLALSEIIDPAICTRLGVKFDIEKYRRFIGGEGNHGLLPAGH